MPDLVPLRRALISVSDKSGLIELGQGLARHGVELISTGGTARAMREAGLTVADVAEVTGFPEMMDGRVKTLHPKVHGGILALRDNVDHQASMVEHEIEGIDLVVVNLYPFEATLARGADFDTCIENIDIGGPAMLRSAAKNHAFVAVVTEPDDYAAVLDELDANGGRTTLGLRRRLAAKTYARTAAYDAAIAPWLAGEVGERFPNRFVLGGQLRQVLRYGENPHQQAAFYVTEPPLPGMATARQVQGKELSYNNLNDADAAFCLASEFAEADGHAVAVIKHANPCGVAVATSQAAAFEAARACDPVSIFGGIVALNSALDEATVEAIGSIFLEVIVAPDATPAAQAALARKKNLRLLLTGGLVDPVRPALVAKTIQGGMLVQDADIGRITAADLKVVTRRAPTDKEVADLLFAFRVAKHVKSNTIVYARDRATVGIGAGQMSRVDSARIAGWKARDAAKEAGEAEPRTVGSAAASDAFFPFADGLEAVIENGASAVIQPGGSMRDQEVIDAADKAGIAMVFCGMRHFRH
jgi:phosphoribosylaminoimidazolecarboxamide formyltransferase/IMP cyclohydrolase